MKKVLVLMMMVLAVGQVVAQPKKSRVPQSEQQKKKESFIGDVHEGSDIISYGT